MCVGVRRYLDIYSEAVLRGLVFILLSPDIGQHCSTQGYAERGWGDGDGGGGEQLWPGQLADNLMALRPNIRNTHLIISQALLYLEES